MDADPALPVLTDEEFAELDVDHDREVHLEWERIIGTYPFPEPPEKEG